MWLTLGPGSTTTAKQPQPPQLPDPNSQPVLSSLQAIDMQPGDDMNEFPEGVEAALILAVRLMLVLISVLQVLLFTFLVCIVADLLTYIRGY